MSLEGWKAFFEIGGVVLLLVTFGFGAGALIVNNRLNAIQATELRDFKLKFEEEQQKTALAQKEVAEARLELANFRAPRVLAPEQQKRIAAKISGFTKSQRIIMAAAPLTVESGTIAGQILDSLKLSFPSADWFKGDNIGPLTKAGAVSSVVVFSTRDKRSIAFAGGLAKALNDEGIKTSTIASMAGCEGMPNIPLDDQACFMVFVVVGTKE
jgi:hypothetical protein